MPELQPFESNGHGTIDGHEDEVFATEAPHVEPLFGSPNGNGSSPKRVSSSDLKIVDLARNTVSAPTGSDKLRHTPAHNGKSETAPGYLRLDVGDWDPGTGRRVEVIIAKLADRVVYLDPDLFVQWDHHTGALPEGAFRVLNRVASMESLPLEYLPQEQRRAYHRLLGESVARLVVDESVEQAAATLDTAEAFVAARRQERSRLWYLETSLAFAGGVVLLGGLAWIIRNPLSNLLGPATFVGLLSAIVGGLGGFASIIQRLGRLPLETAAGRPLHVFDCTTRLFVSVLAAGLVCVAIHAGVAMVAPTRAIPLPVLLLAAAIAGFAERAVPSLVVRSDELKPQVI